MESAPCGCQGVRLKRADPERRRAEKSLELAEAQGDVAAVANARATLQAQRELEQGAHEDAHAWRCPLIGYERETNTALLDENHRAVVDEVNALCGSDIRGCPHAALAPQWVERAVRAYEWQKHLRGRLADIETPTVAIVDAVVEISRSVNAREQHEHNEMMRKQP